MNRRGFIKVIAAGGGTILVPGLFTGCAAESLPALQGWRGPPPGVQDIRRIVLSFAVLAPNPHNTQPWLVELRGPASLRLYVDPQRLLRETDPPVRQIHIGQGTFLENLALAASAHGHRAEVAYFPEGDYGPEALEPRPVAAVTLVADAGVRRDRLFDHVLRRQSNKRAYRPGTITAEEQEGLRRAFDDPAFSLAITTEPGRLGRLAEILEEAMRIETQGVNRNLETLRWFRFSDEEMNRYRDGFGLPQSGLTGFARWFAETFLVSREGSEAPDSTFSKEAVKLTRDQARGCSAIAWITSATNTRLDQVRVGRAYERVNLTATALGLAMHPMSQVLQEYPDMAALQQEFLALLEVPPGHTVQMLFRLGRAAPVTHSPRRPAEALLKT